MFEPVRKILVLDDDEFTANSIKMLLENESYECAAAYNAGDAFKIMKKDTPDLIISDIMMPGMDGISFRKEILKEKKFDKIPFVFLSSQKNDSKILESYTYDIKDYISKSVKPTLQLAKLKNIIRSINSERRISFESIKNETKSAADTLLPGIPDAYAGYSLDYFNKPYNGLTGGDFIDAIDSNERLTIFFGDIMGKKYDAWFLTFSYISYLRSIIRNLANIKIDFTPTVILNSLNEYILNDPQLSDIFSTLSVLQINKETNEILYAGAGDLPLLKYNKRKKIVSRISSTGITPGIKLDAHYSDTKIMLNRYEGLILVTDGVPDSLNGKEMFGFERINESIINAGKTGITENIVCDLEKFTDGQYYDDFSILSIKLSKH